MVQYRQEKVWTEEGCRGREHDRNGDCQDMNKQRSEGPGPASQTVETRWLSRIAGLVPH
jgi:hypothetical protein